MGDRYEVLAELCDRAEALATRLHGLIDKYANEAKRPDVLYDKDVERARRQICSSYTTVLDATQLGAKKFLAVFKERAYKVSNALADDYNLLLEMMKFRSESKTVLTDTIRNSVDFKFGTNSDLTEKLLGLITRYAKLHMLLGPRFHKTNDKCIGPQDIVILYQTAVRCQRGGHDNETNQLKGYLQNFCEGNALRSVKDDMNSISEMVGYFLLRLYDTLHKLIDPDSSTGQIVSSAAFSCVDKIDNLGLPIDTLENHRAGGGLDADEEAESSGAKLMANYYGSAKFYLDMLYVSRMKDWVFFGLLACPSVLGGPEGERAIEMLKMVASDGWKIRVFRDKWVDMHETWEEHFKYLKTQKTASKYFGKAKDHMYNIERTAMTKAGKFHSIRRSFLRNVLPQFLKLFKQCPGALAPQFPVILAVLSLARTELEFYYLHRDDEPRKGGQVYKSMWGDYPKFDMAQWYDPKIVVLVSLADSLRHFCQKHANIVADYHALFVKDIRGAEAESNKECLSALKICHDDFEVCLETMKTATPDTNFFEFRSAWLRCASKINDGWQPPRKYKAQVHLLQAIMDLALRQSRYVDMQATVHTKFTSLHQLWWHANAVVADFQMMSLNADNRFNVDPSVAVGGVRLFNCAVENSHPLVPNDRIAIGEASVNIARRLLTLICRRVAQAVAANYDCVRVLKSITAQAHPDEKTAEAQLHARQDVVYRNRDALQYMCRLAHGFSLVPSVVVFNAELIPRLFLREILSAALKHFILGGSKSPNLVSVSGNDPEHMFKALNIYLAVLGKACDHAGVQQTSLVREVLREQVGSVGASIDARSSVMLSDGETLVSQLSDMFVEYIRGATDADFLADQKKMVTYCPIYEGFIQLGTVGKRGQKQRSLHTKFSTSELSNLMGLIGPTGVRFVQANLLEKVFKPAVRRMLEIVHANKDKIRAFRAHVKSNAPAALPVASSMSHLDEFMTCLGTVSVLMAFRSMLYRALALAGEKTPIIQQFCGLATRGVEFEASSESMDLVSQACGVDPVADHLMQDALAAVRESVLKYTSTTLTGSFSNLAGSIAAVAAAAYTNETYWHHRVEYEPRLGVFNNNAHLFGPTLTKLVYDLTTLEQSEQGQGPGTIGNGGTTSHQVSADVMKEHFTAAAYLLIRLKRNQTGRTEGRMPLQAMICALQTTVESAKAVVSQSFFETVIPYKFVHFCWVEIVRGRRGHDPNVYHTKDPHDLLYFTKRHQ